MDRRSFLASGIALAAASTLPHGAFAAQSKRQSLVEFVKDQAKVDALKKGVAAMKAKKPSDPTSWFFQAAIHGVPQAFVAAAAKDDPGVANVDQVRVWNQCTHFRNAPSADFMLWHRGYIYYFERILRAASGDPSFQLPYWDYSDPTQRGCPRIFAEADVDTSLPPEKQVARNPLYDARRETAWVGGLYDLSERAVSSAAAFNSSTYFAADAGGARTAFGGRWDDLEPASQGLLERSPHNLIHYAIGGVISDQGGTIGDNSAAGLMADPTTSAFDPIFWVHHSNIDRLWNRWGCSKNVNWGLSPPADWLNGKPWWFFDADGSVQNMPREHYFDSIALGIAFDDDDPGCTPLTSTPIKGTQSTMAVLAANNATVGQTSANVELSATNEVGLAVSVTSGDAKLSALVAPGSPRLALELVGIKVTGVPSVGYEVLVRAGSAGEWTSVGLIDLFGRNHAGHTHNPADRQMFDITGIVQGTAAAASLEIKIKPFELLAPKPGSPPILRSGNVTLSGARLVTLQDPNLSIQK